MAPENTLEGIHKMVSLGVRGVEIDVQITSNGVPIVHHNAALPDGRRIAGTNWGDIPEDITSLIDVLQYCRATETWIDVEVKFERGSKESEAEAHLRAMAAGRLVASLLAQYSARPCMHNMLSSFSTSVLAGAEQSAGDRVMTALIMQQLPVKETPLNIVIPTALMHKAGFESYCRDLNVWVWGKEVSKTDALYLFSAGVIGIITDRPDLL